MENQTSIAFIAHILWSIIWPLKGIIYMEEQALQWCYAFGRVWITQYGYLLLIIGASIYAIFCVLGHPDSYRSFGRIIINTVVQLLQTIFHIMFAWVYLLYGAINGRMDNSHQPFRVRMHFHGPHPHWVVTRNYPTLHYMLGRWLYRFFYRIIRWVCNRFNLTLNTRQSATIARIMAVLVIIWGVWNIPYDLTH